MSCCLSSYQLIFFTDYNGRPIITVKFSLSQFRCRRKMAEAENSPYPKPFSNKIQYERKDVLGEGNSIVYRGTYEDEEVAVKRIVLGPSLNEDREFKAKLKLNHQNVLKILTVEQDADFRQVERMDD